MNRFGWLIGIFTVLILSGCQQLITGATPGYKLFSREVSGNPGCVAPAVRLQGYTSSIGDQAREQLNRIAAGQGARYPLTGAEQADTYHCVVGFSVQESRALPDGSIGNLVLGVSSVRGPTFWLRRTLE